MRLPRQVWCVLILVLAWSWGARASDCETHVGAALAAKHAGDLDQAEWELGQALEDDAQSVQAHWVLAWVLVARGDRAAAVAEFGQVAALDRRSRLAAEARSAVRWLTRPAGSSIPPAAPGDKRLALTFDDGPTPGVTDSILAALARAEAKATFFVVGNRVRAWPALVRREVAAGHEVELHGWDHSLLSGRSDAAIRDQMYRSLAALSAAGAPAPHYLRPPYGGWDEHLRATAGLPLVLWSGSTEDWRTRSAKVVVDAVLRLARPGAILLMHDLPRSTAAALPTVLTRLKAQGYTLVTVHDLLGDRAPGEVLTR